MVGCDVFWKCSGSWGEGDGGAEGERVVGGPPQQDHPPPKGGVGGIRGLGE